MSGVHVRHCLHLFASALGLRQFLSLVPAGMRQLMPSHGRSKIKFYGQGAEEAEISRFTQIQLFFMKKK